MTLVETALGPDHQEVVARRGRLADNLDAQGRSAEARALRQG